MYFPEWERAQLHAVGEELITSGIWNPKGVTAEQIGLPRTIAMWLVLTGICADLDDAMAKWADKKLAQVPPGWELDGKRLLYMRRYRYLAPPWRDGDRVVGGNYMQLQAHTVLAAGVTDLIVYRGNFINVEFQPAWTRLGGNNAQRSFCYHLHPDLPLPVEVKNCPHVVDIDWIRIDSQLIDTVYHREDTKV